MLFLKTRRKKLHLLRVVERLVAWIELSLSSVFLVRSAPKRASVVFNKLATRYFPESHTIVRVLL